MTYLKIKNKPNYYKLRIRKCYKTKSNEEFNPYKDYRNDLFGSYCLFGDLRKIRYAGECKVISNKSKKIDYSA